MKRDPIIRKNITEIEKAFKKEPKANGSVELPMIITNNGELIYHTNRETNITLTATIDRTAGSIRISEARTFCPIAPSQERYLCRTVNVYNQLNQNKI